MVFLYHQAFLFPGAQEVSLRLEEGEEGEFPSLVPSWMLMSLTLKGYLRMLLTGQGKIELSTWGMWRASHTRDPREDYRDCGEAHLLSSTGFLFVIIPLHQLQDPMRPPLNIWLVFCLHWENFRVGQWKTAVTGKKQGRGPQGSHQPQSEARLQSAAERGSWCMKRFHGNPRNAGEQESGRRTDLPGAKRIGTWGAIIFTE